MIKRLTISGVHLEITDELKKYVTKKIGRLDHFIPKASKGSMHAEVRLMSTRAADKSDRTCEIVLHLPQENLTIKETTINIYAAIDIAETKLRQQLKKYKALHTSPRLHQRMLAKLKHRPLPLES